MAEQRVTDEQLDLDAIEARATSAPLLPAATLIGIDVPQLLAEVRASRAREARLRENWEFQHGVAQGWLANWKAAQQRIDNVLAMCGAARPLMLGSGCHQPFAVGGLLVDADRIRAALTETAETAVNGPVSGGSGQDSGPEAASDA